MFKYRLISFPLLLFLAFLVVFSPAWGPKIFMLLSLPITLAAVYESCNIAKKLNLPVNRPLAMLFGLFMLLKYGIASALPVKAAMPDALLGLTVLFALMMAIN